MKVSNSSEKLVHILLHILAQKIEKMTDDKRSYQLLYKSN